MDRDEAVEERSLVLLSQFVDNFDLERYRKMDYIYAVGGSTGITYRIQRYNRVQELNGLGENVKEWCIDVPGVTSVDRTLVLKLLIETNEELFKKLSNKVGVRPEVGSEFIMVTGWAIEEELKKYIPDDEYNISSGSEWFPWDIWLGNDFECEDQLMDNELNELNVVADGSGMITVGSNELYINGATRVTNPFYLASCFGEVITPEVTAVVTSNSNEAYFYNKIIMNINDLSNSLEYCKAPPIKARDCKSHWRDLFEQYRVAVWQMKYGDYFDGMNTIQTLEFELGHGALDLSYDLMALFGSEMDTYDENDAMHVGSKIVKWIFKETELDDKIILPVDFFPILEYQCQYYHSPFMLLNENYVCSIRQKKPNSRLIYCLFPMDNCSDYAGRLMNGH